MAASISTSVLVNADHIDKAEIDVFDGTGGPIASFEFRTTDGEGRVRIQSYFTDPHEFAFAIRALGDRLVEVADDWAQAQGQGNPDVTTAHVNAAALNTFGGEQS